MYLDESSLSVLFWKVITCLSDVCIIDCESIYDCMIKPLLALAYPSVLLCVLLCGTLFCDDHQLVDVSRYEEHPWSTGM